LGANPSAPAACSYACPARVAAGEHGGGTADTAGGATRPGKGRGKTGFSFTLESAREAKQATRTTRSTGNGERGGKTRARDVMPVREQSLGVRRRSGR